MKIKGKIAVVCFGLLLSMSALSQQNTERKSPEERAAVQLQLLTKELKLTPKQATEVELILADQAKTVDSLRQNTERGRGMMKEMRDRDKAVEARFQAVLTPEQFSAFQQMKDERRRTARQRRMN
jgi:periplasmic protein CpxP/Spy